MEEERMNELMMDYLEGKLSGELKSFVEKHINKSPENKEEFEALKATLSMMGNDRELEPDASLRLEFLNQIEEEIQQLSGTRSIQPNFWSNYGWKVAAAIAFVAVGALATMLLTNRSEMDKMQALQEDLNETKAMLELALQNDQSASQRMKSIQASFSVAQPDEDMINVLIEVMNNDDNVNVRLAAIEALSNFSSNAQVRKALVQSLKQQKEAMIQITLINVLVGIEAKGAVDELNNIIEDSTTLPVVRDEAHMAVFKLS